MTGIRIRDLEDSDIHEVTRIYAHYVLTSLVTFEETPPDAEEMTRRIAAIREAGLPYLVAADQSDRPVGFAYASRYRPRPAYRFTVEDSIYVDEAWHSLGIGRRLLEALVEHCAHGPAKQMVAIIGDSDNVGSIALHRACGFEQVGVLTKVGFKFGRWVDTVIMQRALGS